MGPPGAILGGFSFVGGVEHSLRSSHIMGSQPWRPRLQACRFTLAPIEPKRTKPEGETRMKTHGSAVWSGGIKDGKGAISTKSGALQAYPYGFASRFEGKAGSNPEELIGAAHAACFTMALSLILGEAGLTAERMETTAEVTLEKVSDGFAITAVHLTLEAKIPGANDSRFQELAAKAKAGCPVSKLLKADITLDASLAA
jgi:lipoyl-dependent peroxiredoxin